jgi:hypothetical protein
VDLYAINLDRDRERLDRLSAALDGRGFRTVRIAAVRGSSLPAAAVAFVPGAATLGPGTLGCFLSHLRAWEEIAGSGTPAAIVLEDDALPLPALRAGAAGLAESGRDLVFIHRGLSLRTDPANGAAPPRRIATLEEVVLSRVGLKQVACGAYGYFLTAAGARALCAVVASRGVSGHADWFLLMCGLGAGGIGRIAANRTFHRKLLQMNNFYRIEAPVVAAAALSRGLVGHAQGPSSRLEENTAATGRAGGEGAQAGGVPAD